jgi:mannose-6-phosphate isomerase-like protein (cupin superfamily)
MSHIPEENIFDRIEKQLTESRIKIESKETGRPWGGYFVIDESSAEPFIKKYFPESAVSLTRNRTKNISPKILLVAPGARLSWQYHHRRSEVWQVTEGPVGIITSENNVEGEQKTLNKGDTIKLHVGLRHRLIGLENWGVVAEIWIHEYSDNPSDENDIVRITDDYGR